MISYNLLKAYNFKFMSQISSNHCAIFFFVNFLISFSDSVRELLDENQRCLNHLTSLLQGNTQEIKHSMMVCHFALAFYSYKTIHMFIPQSNI